MCCEVVNFSFFLSLSFFFFFLLKNYAHLVDKWIKFTKITTSVYLAWTWQVLQFFTIIFHWKPEISLALMVAPTLCCAGSEQVKCVDLQALLALLSLRRRKLNLIHTFMIMSICSHQQNCHWNKCTFFFCHHHSRWKHCNYYSLLTRKLWLQ